MDKKRVVSAWTRSEVWDRDDWQCTHETGGERCEKTEDLIVWALGEVAPGLEDDPCSYALLCQPHARLRALDVPEQDWAHA